MIDAGTRNISTDAYLGLGSKKWKGFYEQHGQQFDMKFECLTVTENGEIHGKGKDQVGRFVINGIYLTTPTTDVQFVKQYLNMHNVLYSGKVNEKIITGRWEIYYSPTMSDGGQFMLTVV